MAQPLRFTTDFDPAVGTLQPVAPGVARLTAPNRGPYTFTGTNTYLIGNERLFVLDPGPASMAHLVALRTAIGGRPLEAILLTHTHKDHSALALRLARETRAPLWFGGRHRPSRPRRPLEVDPLRFSADWRLEPDRTLRDGERLGLGDVALDVVATPGHCANHLAFGLAGTPSLLTGDHVMGWNTTLVAVPDGSMGDYLASLDKLIGAPYRHYLPAHGGPIADGPDHARALKAHREARNGQIVSAVKGGARTVGAVARLVYPTLRGPLARAARMTVAAHAEFLAERGDLEMRATPLGMRLRPRL